jgi:ribose-phosphate pyrophosphokinase
MSEIIGCDMAILHKERPKHNQAEITALIGDVKGKDCILNDDMIDTGGSVLAAVKTLKARGAKRVYVCCTHPVFSGPAYERMNDPAIEEVVVCNTIPIPEEQLGGKIKVLSVAPLFARAIRNVFGNSSISDLFDPDFAL